MSHLWSGCAAAQQQGRWMWPRCNAWQQRPAAAKDCSCSMLLFRTWSGESCPGKLQQQRARWMWLRCSAWQQQLGAANQIFSAFVVVVDAAANLVLPSCRCCGCCVLGSGAAACGSSCGEVACLASCSMFFERQHACLFAAGAVLRAPQG